VSCVSVARRRAPQLLIVLLVIAAAVAVGAPRAAAADIGAFGVNDIRSDGLLMRHAEYDGVGDMELMRQGGIRLYRARVRMDCVDPDGDGAFDFTGPGRGCPDYDELVGELARRGITLLPVLMNFGTNAEGREHPLAPTGRDGAPSVERFAAFARAVAERYGPTGSFWGVCGCDPRPVRAWQIWNEQNNGWWWNGRASADEYARLFAATRAALRAVDPEARAIVGGLTYDRNGEASFVSPEKVIARLAATNPNAFDAVAVHPYTDARVGDGQRIGAAALRLVERTAQAVARATGPARDGGPRQPVWVTEIGWSHLDADPQTIAAATRAFLAGLDGGVRRRAKVGPVLWYMLRDTATLASRDDGLGLRYTAETGRDAGPKPAWEVFAAAAQRAGSLPLPRALPDTRRPVVRVRARGKGGKVQVQVTCGPGRLACSGDVSLRSGARGHAAGNRRTAGKTLGSRAVRVRGGRATVTVNLSQRGRVALRRDGRLRVLVEVTVRDATGVPATATARATVRR